MSLFTIETFVSFSVISLFTIQITADVITLIFSASFQFYRMIPEGNYMVGVTSAGHTQILEGKMRISIYKIKKLGSKCRIPEVISFLFFFKIRIMLGFLCFYVLKITPFYD